MPPPPQTRLNKWILLPESIARTFFNPLVVVTVMTTFALIIVVLSTFVILILFSSVFTLILGCGREVVTSSAQAAPSDPGAENDPYRPAIADVAFIDSSEAWAIHRSGTVLYHLVKGTPLRKHATDFGSRPLISFVDRDTGFAFAHSVERATLWRTTDAGQSWQKVTDFDQTIPDLQLTAPQKVHFVDPQHGWLVDVFNIWRTQDGGVHWKKISKAADVKGGIDELRQVSFSGVARALVATKQAIYLTSDGGRVWKPVNNNEFSAIYSLDERTSWAWSDSLERTDDGGKTWRKVYGLKGIIEIFSTQFINKNEGWAAGVEVPESFASVVRNPSAPQSNGILLHTKDGGKTWDRGPQPTDKFFRRVAFSDSKHGWLLGVDRLYRTVNGGLTWTIALDASGGR